MKDRDRTITAITVMQGKLNSLLPAIQGFEVTPQLLNGELVTAIGNVAHLMQLLDEANEAGLMLNKCLANEVFYEHQNDRKPRSGGNSSLL